MTDTPLFIPAESPDSGVATQCDGHRPFLLLGDSTSTIVACLRTPGRHIWHGR